MNSRSDVFPQLVLVLVTLLWGSTFLTLQVALQWADASVIVAWRFALACLFYVFILRSKIFKVRAQEWFAGALTGASIYIVFLFQTIGLASIPSSTSAFLTGLYVAFVPILQWLCFRTRPNNNVILGVILAFIGMSLLANPFEMSFSNNIGEWITIVSAFMCAVEILLTAKFAPKCHPLHLGFVQMVTVMVLSALTVFIFEPSRPTQYCWQLGALIGVLAAIVAFIQFVISWALKTVPALRATMIYSLEPVFAGIIGWMAGERLGWLGLSGGALIVGAVLISSLKPKKLRLEK